MKRFKLPLLTLSVLLYSASAFAQHGHVGGSMGPGNHAMSHSSTLGTSEQGLDMDNHITGISPRG